MDEKQTRREFLKGLTGAAGFGALALLGAAAAVKGRHFQPLSNETPAPGLNVAMCRVRSHRYEKRVTDEPQVAKCRVRSYRYKRPAPC